MDQVPTNNNTYTQSDTQKTSNAWVWMDLEMTGLDPTHDGIIEIATLVTDTNLQILAKGPEIVVHQDSMLLDSMDEWNQKHHSESGLIERVKQSKITINIADEMTAQFISQYVQPKTAPLCGNSIWQDRRFIERYLPKTAALLHYRMIDVSTLKVLARTWQPKLTYYAKKAQHRALADIEESIAELKYYRKHLLQV